MPAEAYYEFDAFRLDAVTGFLLQSGMPISLRPLACELLRVFLTHPQEILSDAFLIKQAWDGVVSLSKGAVAFHIFELRRALGDDARTPRFIERITNRGYRFLPAVRRSAARTESAELYEKARHLYHKSTANEMLHAIEYYQRVIALDREYVADAYAGISECYLLLGTFVLQTMPAHKAMKLAREAALKALSLDYSLAEAHAALGSVFALYDWQWATAKCHYETALALPANKLAKPLIRTWFALGLAARGDAIQARIEIDLAKADFPSSSVLAALSGRIAYIGGDFDKAIQECHEGMTLEPYLFLSPLFKGHALRGKGQYTEAELSFRRACELTDDSPMCLAELAHLYAIQGRADECDQLINRLERIAKEQYVSPYVFAHINLGRRDLDEMFRGLEMTYVERGVYLIFLTTDPVYGSVRDDPRFRALIQRVGFTESKS